MDEVSIGAMFMWTSQSINCCTLRFCLFFHNFKHNPGSQTKTVLEQQTFCHNLIFPDAVCILGKQFLLLICHGGKQFLLVPADQLE